ncbi:MAG: septum formation initiator family protein [Calditrichaceae bacterium]
MKKNIKRVTSRRKTGKLKLGSVNKKWVVGLIVVGLIYFYFLQGSRGTIEFYRNYRAKQEIMNEIEALKQKKEELLIEKAKLNNDSEYIEKIAREKYKMKKKDEKVYQIIVK